MSQQQLRLGNDVAEGSLHANVQARYPALEPKHDLFLSHSGIDKDFTDLLHERLKDRGYRPFFDKAWDSLPPGSTASVANLLFDAARQCCVLIVIVSEAFFTNSEWPMLELSAFVESQREALDKGESAVSILPVYWGLTKDEVKDEASRKRWCQSWSTMKENGAKEGTGSGKPPIDIEHWGKAVQALVDQSGKYTSCEYEQASGLTGLLTKTLDALRGLLRPPKFRPDPAVQGRERICNAVNRKIEESRKTKAGVCKVGLYGMAGIGKSSFCKEFCASNYLKFRGKVCHAEFLPLSDTDRPRNWREAMRKEVLENLTNINPRDIPDKISDSHLHRIREEKVFLVLDNVQPDAELLEEARKYLTIWGQAEANASVGNGTIVIVTAQSIETLDKVGINSSNCLEMPDLVEEEARKLFLLYAAPDYDLKPEDDRYVRYCLRLCYFSKGESAGKHYHPLALTALGNQLQSDEPDPSSWEKELSRDDVFNQMHVEGGHPIFRILRRGFDMLHPDDQLLFVDVVLFRPDRWGNLFRGTSDDHGANISDWLLLVHPRFSDRDSLKKGLQILKKRGIIVDTEDVSVHDLYFDFAKWEAATYRSKVWVWSSGVVVPDFLDMKPPGGLWAEVVRFSLFVRLDTSYYKLSRDGDKYNKSIEKINGIDWDHFPNVAVLELYMESSLTLDLSALANRLRSLKIHVNGGRVVGLWKLRNLEWLDLSGIHHTECVGEIGCLSELQLLRFRCDSRECVCMVEIESYYRSVGQWEEAVVSQAVDLHNVEKCTKLRELVLECNRLKAFPDLCKMIHLRRAVLIGGRHSTEMLGLGPQLSKLEELQLNSRKPLRPLPNLAGLVSIQVLELSGISCFEVQEFRGLNTLTRLQVLTINCARQLLELPQLVDLISLERLYLTHLPMMREFPNMKHLTRLQNIELLHSPALIVQLKEKVPLRYVTVVRCCVIGGHQRCGVNLWATNDYEVKYFDLSTFLKETGYSWEDAHYCEGLSTFLKETDAHYCEGIEEDEEEEDEEEGDEEEDEEEGSPKPAGARKRKASSQAGPSTAPRTTTPRKKVIRGSATRSSRAAPAMPLICMP